LRSFVDGVIGGLGGHHLRAVQIGSGQQLAKRQQGTWHPRPLLPVYLLKAADICPQADDLRFHQRDPLRQRRPIPGFGLVQVLQVEGGDTHDSHSPTVPAGEAAREVPVAPPSVEKAPRMPDPCQIDRSLQESNGEPREVDRHMRR
jgi:hypothetical protein